MSKDKDKKKLDRLEELAALVRVIREMELSVNSSPTSFLYTCTPSKELMDNINKLNQIVADELDEYANLVKDDKKVAYHETEKLLKDLKKTKK